MSQATLWRNGMGHARQHARELGLFCCPLGDIERETVEKMVYIGCVSIGL